MKIALIFTGGTIGSSIQNDYIGVDDKTKYLLLKKYENDNDIDFVISSPYTILSENLSANELNLLQKEISNKISQDFDGIIVTHGSDTLQYSSTAMEYAFCDAQIPIIFVSANYPLGDERSNGYPNFEAAVEFIRNKVAAGVFVSYKNDNDKDTKIHIPSHTLQHNEINADVYSIDGTTLADYDGKFTLYNVKMPEKTNSIGVIEYTIDSQILVISSTPGQNYEYSLKNVKAILFKPYHCATLNTSNEKLVGFCKKAYEKQIPMFVLGFGEHTGYESTRIYDELNIIPLPHSTFISAYVKLWIATSNGYDIEEFMKKQIANEFI